MIMKIDMRRGAELESPHRKCGGVQSSICASALQFVQLQSDNFT
jgi:hypothetical protein